MGGSVVVMSKVKREKEERKESQEREWVGDSVDVRCKVNVENLQL